MTNPYIAADEFRALFGAAEYALKRSEFRRVKNEKPEPAWDLYARSLGSEFFNHVVTTGIAKTLIGHPPRQLMAETMQWAPEQTTPLTNVHQLFVEGVCRVRNSYVHGEKFTGGPEGQWARDAVLIAEAHAVLAEALTFLPPGGRSG
jgi:hypothetical protein